MSTEEYGPTPKNVANLERVLAEHRESDLRRLSEEVAAYIVAIDKLFAEPPSFSRGSKQAKLLNSLHAALIMWGSPHVAVVGH